MNIQDIEVGMKVTVAEPQAPVEDAVSGTVVAVGHEYALVTEHHEHDVEMCRRPSWLKEIA